MTVENCKKGRCFIRFSGLQPREIKRHNSLLLLDISGCFYMLGT